MNWPAFDRGVRAKVKKMGEGYRCESFHVVGHLGRRGRGEGLNRAHLMKPVAVGFFDTHGPGFADEVRALRRARVPTLIMHSVETAGVAPRRLREYDGNHDYGMCTLPLDSVREMPHLPDAASFVPFRCAAIRRTRALIVDTGEAARTALIPVALGYSSRRPGRALTRRELRARGRPDLRTSRHRLTVARA
jgi:hypothetical protein